MEKTVKSTVSPALILGIAAIVVALIVVNHKSPEEQFLDAWMHQSQ